MFEFCKRRYEGVSSTLCENYCNLRTSTICNTWKTGFLLKLLQPTLKTADSSNLSSAMAERKLSQLRLLQTDHRGHCLLFLFGLLDLHHLQISVELKHIFTKQSPLKNCCSSFWFFLLWPNCFLFLWNTKFPENQALLYCRTCAIILLW